MKPEENVCHILVLSYSTLHTAEAVAAWNEAVAVGIPFSHAVFTHYLLDGNVDFLVLLDLLDFLCNKFFSLLLLAPSAASWSRARHANSAVRHVRSRAHPLGCPDLLPRDRQYTQDSNNNFIVAAWFVEQAALHRVPFLFLCPEDFGGHSQHGPASPWSLVEFQRVSGLNDVWRGAAFMCRFAHTEQRHPTGMLTNIQGLQRSVYLGWPTFNCIDGNLQYSGPLPKVCPCSVQHQEAISSSKETFTSSSSFTLSSQFWFRLLQCTWQTGQISLRAGEEGLSANSAGTVSLASATGSWQPLYDAWKSNQLSRSLLRDYAEGQDVDLFLSSPLAASPFLSGRSLVASACSSCSTSPLHSLVTLMPVSSASSASRSCSHLEASPVYASPQLAAPGYASQHRSMDYASWTTSPILSRSTVSGTRLSTEAPLVPLGQRGVPPMAMADRRTGLPFIEQG